VGSDNIGRSSLDLFFFNNNTSSLIENVIDSSHNIRRSSDFSNKDRFLERRGGGQFTTIIDSSGSRDQLTSSSVDGIGVEYNVHDVNSDGSHVFVSHNSFLGGPLESIFHRVFNFRHELDSFSGIDQDISTLIFGSESPDLKSISFFPSIGFLKHLGSFFNFGSGSTFSRFNIFSKTFFERYSLTIKSIMFIGGFSETDLVRFFSHGFFIGNNGVSFDDFNIGEFSFKIM